MLYQKGTFLSILRVHLLYVPIRKRSFLTNTNIFCAACFTTHYDIMFLVDSSGSISSADFNVMRQVMLEVSKGFKNLITSNTQVGILQYGHNHPARLVWCCWNLENHGGFFSKWCEAFVLFMSVTVTLK